MKYTWVLKHWNPICGKGGSSETFRSYSELVTKLHEVAKEMWSTHETCSNVDNELLGRYVIAVYLNIGGYRTPALIDFSRDNHPIHPNECLWIDRAEEQVIEYAHAYKNLFESKQKLDEICVEKRQ